MSKYSAVQAPIFALFDPGLYDAVRYEWKGTNLLYLCGLLAVLTAATALGLFIQLTAVSNNEAQKIIGQFPKMTFKDGEMSIDKPSPYRVSNPWPTADDAGMSLIVFDTSGNLTSTDDAKAAILFTKTEMVSNSGKNLTYSTYGQSGVIDQDLINSWLRMGVFLIPVAFFLFGWPLAWIGHAFQGLIYAGIAALVGQVSGSPLPFSAALRLSIMCMTPVMLISTVMYISHLIIPYWQFLCIPVIIGYIVFAIRTTAKSS